MIIHTPPKAAETIPIIDLAGTFTALAETQRAIAWEVHKACRERGFFYLANHRIPETLIARRGPTRLRQRPASRAMRDLYGARACQRDVPACLRRTQPELADA